MHAIYAPQRVYPRFSVLAHAASRVPRGLPLLMAALGPAIAERTAINEIPSPTDLATTRLAIVAFPRTGSVFMKALADKALGEPVRTMRTHDPLLIRTLARFSIPIIIPIRDPQDTILSWSVYNSDPVRESFLVARCHSYLAWARKVLRLSHRLPLNSVSLQTFTASHGEILGQVLGYPIPTNHSIADLERKTIEELVSNETVALNQQHLPDIGRDRLKISYQPARTFNGLSEP